MTVAFGIVKSVRVCASVCLCGWWWGARARVVRGAVGALGRLVCFVAIGHMGKHARAFCSGRALRFHNF